MQVFNWTAMAGFIFLLSQTSAVHAAEVAAQKKAAPAATSHEDDPHLPRVLLIGDSISIGYTPFVHELLAKQANVHHPSDNCGPTIRGIEKLDRWLGDKPWDVIHFNFGLHDMKYVAPEDGDPNTPNGHQQVPLPQYEANLRKLVARLKKTGATLIWCTTTPVPPEGTNNRVADDVVQYNQAALRVMQENDIAVNDLYAFAKPRLSEIQKPRNVHYTEAGYRKLAGQVAIAIEAALARRQHASSQKPR